MSATMPYDMKSWVQVDSSQGAIYISPTSNTRLGLWRSIELTLSDGKEETNYELIFWVLPEKSIEDEEGVG